MNECLKVPPLYKDACPLPNQMCTNMPGNFSCDCVDGYEIDDPADGCKSIAIRRVKEEVRN